MIHDCHRVARSLNKDESLALSNPSITIILRCPKPVRAVCGLAIIAKENWYVIGMLQVLICDHYQDQLAF